MYFIEWKDVEGNSKSQVCEGYIERLVLEEKLDEQNIMSTCRLVEEVLAERI
ncbi:hypothetical protein [Priestia aryabhattai]|uniref:hypothetical protein n=1 Tax=Priestia aryabhattai TaxID=412384 RepID=UPI0015F5E206|nr:hypothetical protein [Priestia aryabhattai]